MVSNKEKNFISAVIYVHNQEKEIYFFLELVEKSLSQLFEKYEVICVDDSSSDNSMAEIKRFASVKSGSMVSVIHMSFHQGLELSMNAGIDLAIGDFVYEFDTLFSSYPEEMIQKIYFRSLEGYDIVSAAPKKQDHHSSSLFYYVFNKSARSQYMLRTEVFRILSRRAINRVHSMSRTIPYRKAVYANCGLKKDVLFYQEGTVPLKADQETKRQQKETAVDAIVLYTDLAYRCSMVFSFLMMGIAVLTGLYTVVIYLSGKPVAGWTTTMLFLALAFLGLFIILTILIKYLSLILKLNFNRQKYLIESIEKLK